MPTYGLPGVAVGLRGARATGIVALTVVVVLAVGWRLAPTGTDPNRLTVELLTDHIGTGIDSGSDVRLDGVKVGAVGSTGVADGGWQSIELELDQSQILGLTDTLSVDFAPGNLFGVSEIQLHPASGGETVVDGSVIDLTGDARDRVDDATISTVLSSLGEFTTGVLTPQLTEVLRRIDIGATAFTPLFQAIIDMIRVVADTQHHPAPFLLREYGSALAGLPWTVDGGIQMLYTAYDSEYMKSADNRTKFDATSSMLKDDLIPALVPVLTTAQPHFNGLTDQIAPILDVIASTVPSPQSTGRDLGVLLTQLDSKFHDTPHGPVVDFSVDLRGIPALSGPLQGALPAGTDGAR